MSTRVPYCGLPPAPQNLAMRWNLDPVLIACLLAMLGLFLWTARRRPGDRGTTALCAGWAVSSLALISPLCALSVSLFSARIGQHMLLTLIAAPLLAVGLLQAKGPGHPMAAALTFLLLLWFWHAPGPYAATFNSPAVYWAMHLSLIGAAVWLWHELLTGPPSLGRLGAAAISMVQMGFLGALLTLAPHALFGPHQLTTVAWGLTPLQDQQLGGALMWAPGGLAFLAVALIIARHWLGGAAPRMVSAQ